MTVEAKRTLGVTVLALGLWAVFPNRAFWPSIFVIALLFLTQLATSVQELITMTGAAYGGSSLWIIIAGFIIAHALDVSGLSKRIALKIVSKLGGNSKRVIFSIAIANLAIAPLSPSTTAKAFLILPICISIAETFNAKKGLSNFGKALFLMSAAANNICASMFLTATVPNSVSQKALATTGADVSWLAWFAISFPPNILLLLVAWIIITRLYRPEVKVIEGGAEAVKQMSAKLGPMSRGEKLSLIVFATAIILWVTEPLYMNFLPSPLNAGLISMILCILLFIPKIGVIKLGRFGKSIPFGPIALFAAALYLADAISKTHAFDPLVQELFNVLGIHAPPLIPTLVVVIFLSIFLHIFFTSTTAYATVVLPVVVAVATIGGLPPVALALPVAITMAYAFILPMNTIPNVVMLNSGYFRQKHMIIYGLMLSITATLVILLLAIPYWQIIGFFPP
jgi:anion transporter